MALESIKHEVLKTKRSYVEEFNYLGRIDYLKLVYILLNVVHLSLSGHFLMGMLP